MEHHPQNPPPCLQSWQSPTTRTPQHLRRTADGCLLTRTVLNMLLSKSSSKEFCKITILIQMINTFSHGTVAAGRGTVAVNGTVAAGRGTVAGGSHCSCWLWHCSGWCLQWHCSCWSWHCSGWCLQPEHLFILGSAPQNALYIATKLL